jgi:uncharacterized protein YkwD
MLPRTRLGAALAISCVGALGQASAADAACPGADIGANQQSTAEIEQSVLCLVNGERLKAGLGEVRPNEKLRLAAAAHSNDMVTAGYFAHTSPAGVDFIDRITATGYLRRARSWQVGENLVWGTGQLGTPASMVAAWMESPPHRANLLRGRFREIGIAASSGTPSDALDRDGVTISSDYGYRKMGTKKARRARKNRRARRARRNKRHRAQIARLGLSPAPAGRRRGGLDQGTPSG